MAYGGPSFPGMLVCIYFIILFICGNCILFYLRTTWESCYHSYARWKGTFQAETELYWKAFLCVCPEYNHLKKKKACSTAFFFFYKICTGMILISQSCCKSSSIRYISYIAPLKRHPTECLLGHCCWQSSRRWESDIGPERRGGGEGEEKTGQVR